jgi:Aspartyl protease
MKRGVSFVVLTCLTATVVGWAQGLPREGDLQTGIPFEVNRNFGSILIRAQVNGKPATLVVDTGSSHTILSSELLQVRPVALEHADAPAKGSGYVGSAGWAKATVEIGTIRWQDQRVLVMSDFQEISNSMKRRIDGILGEDVLRAFDSVVIDFKHHRLVLLR